MLIEDKAFLFQHLFGVARQVTAARHAFPDRLDPPLPFCDGFIRRQAMFGIEDFAIGLEHAPHFLQGGLPIWNGAQNECHHSGIDAV